MLWQWSTDFKLGSKNNIENFVRKVLRRILLGVRVGGEWCIWRNKELYETYVKLEVTILAWLQRLHWARHLQRMHEEKTQKGIKVKNWLKKFNRKPRTIWEDRVYAEDETLLGVRNWKTQSLGWVIKYLEPVTAILKDVLELQRRRKGVSFKISERLESKLFYFIFALFRWLLCYALLALGGW